MEKKKHELCKYHHSAHWEMKCTGHLEENCLQLVSSSRAEFRSNLATPMEVLLNDYQPIPLYFCRTGICHSLRPKSSAQSWVQRLVFGRCSACHIAAANYILLIHYKCEHDWIMKLDIQINFLGFNVNGVNGVLNCFPLHSLTLMLSHLMWKEATFNITRQHLYMYLRAWQFLCLLLIYFFLSFMSF